MLFIPVSYSCKCYLLTPPYLGQTYQGAWNYQDDYGVGASIILGVDSLTLEYPLSGEERGGPPLGSFGGFDSGDAPPLMDFPDNGVTAL